MAKHKGKYDWNRHRQIEYEQRIRNLKRYLIRLESGFREALTRVGYSSGDSHGS